MEIRGERECQDCGTRWRYYDTGDVACPACGSLVSVGVDERTHHTDTPVELDLSSHRRTADEEGIIAAAEAVVPDLREYLARRGFVDAGDLRPLDDTYLAAAELRHAADAVTRRETVTDDERIYLLSLFAGADGPDRPDPSTVPASLAGPRAVAYAEAVLDYRGEVITTLRGEEAGRPRRLLGRVADRAKRVQALDGDVSLDEAEALVDATRAAVDALEGDASALERATDRLDALD